MRWQRAAQAAIAVFVIGFIVVLVVTLRRERVQPPPQEAPERADPKSTLETPQGGRHQVVDPSGREEWNLEFGTHVVLADGRNHFTGGVKATINRGDSPLVITAREASIVPAEEGSKEPKEAVFRGDAVVSGSDGLEVKGNEITYTHADGLITMPGPVTFKKGRTTGSGVNATYDQEREVFWIREQGRVNVAPAPGGDGAIDASANAIGMARREHYMRLEGAARINGQGRTAEADGIVVRLSEDDQRVRALELRGDSRITGTDGALQSMAARDIDMSYADDGQTLQSARLVGNASVQLPGDGAGRRITGSTIDIALGPDGTSITNLVASAPVQVDLPGEGEAPAKRILSSTLTATGQPGEGLRGATFGGGVEYRETRAAQRNLAAIDRTATSETLIVETQPGLGAIQRADFRGNVRFSEPPDFVAQAQRGIYDIARDRLELTPSPGLPGPVSPTVTDGNVSVAARTIQFGLGTRELVAETAVRSTIDPKGRTKDKESAKLPSVLAEDEPVNVTSNRLVYKGAGSSAVYTGAATLWQGADTTIKGDSITIEEKTGNLTASGKATTAFIFEDADPKSGRKRRQSTTGTADTFVYDDSKRMATYTGKARMTGPQGDVAGERIILYLKADANELERAEATGPNGVVTVREGNRFASGSHLTYTASDDRYLLVGTPVRIIEERNRTCTLMEGTTATFNRATEHAEVSGVGGSIPSRNQTLKSCPPELRR